MAAKKKQEASGNTLSPSEQFEAFLRENPDQHYNFTEDYDFIIGSGSLTLDIKMNGGVRPGVIRFSGVTEGGKTSCALSFANQFQKKIPNGMVIYIKAEGRLSQDVLDRSGIDTSEERFKIFKCNMYETIINMIENQIKNNPSDYRYFFIIDSMDALNLMEDQAKVVGKDNAKPMGAAALSSFFLKRMALPLAELGHICVVISQVRSDVKMDQYAKTKGQNTGVVSASGGHALLHYSDWILEFFERGSGGLIRENPNDKQSEIIGHYCKLAFKKTPNEKSMSEVSYPIRYGRTGGKSVWIEKEIADLLLQFGLVKRKGAWFNFEPSFAKNVTDKTGFDVTELKWQGFENFSKFFEDEKVVTDYLYSYFSEGLSEEL